MARETEQYRTSIQQVAPQQGIPQPDNVAAAVADIGNQIIVANQEAKITDNFSKAQLDLLKLGEQYKIDYEHDPLGGVEKLKADRQRILDGYGKQIDPLFRSSWNENARQLAAKDDLMTEGWAYKQMKVNTVKSINSAIKNNLSQAAIDGVTFGTSDSDEIGSMLNFAQSKQQLVGFGDKHLGATTTTDLLENYDGDYLKSFISGVSESNPLKALRLMERDDVKNSFKDKGQYLAMKNAVETRALNVDKINGENQVLSVLKDENNVLTQSLQQPMSYAALQAHFDANPKMSAYAKSFFLKANGYEKGGKLDPSEQLKNKAELYSELSAIASSEDVKTEDVKKFQDRVYQAMDNGTLSETEGALYLSQVVTPLVAKKEEQLGKFSQNNLFGPDLGVKGLQELFEDRIQIRAVEDAERWGITKALGMNETDVGNLVSAKNDQNKVKLYDFYMTALQQGAASYGVQIDKVPDLNKAQQRKLYTEAQNQAYKMFMVDQNPALATLPDMPNQTFSNGKLIQGMAGDRSLKPDVSAKKSFDIQLGSDGYLYRLYPDGTREKTVPAPEGMKF